MYDPATQLVSFSTQLEAKHSLTYVICLSYQVEMDVFTGNGVNTTAVGILIQSDRTTMRKETGVNGVNIFRIPGRARQALSFLKTQSCQLHAVKNGKCSTSWNVRRCRLRKQHRLLLKRKRTAMKWGVRARSV